MTLYQIIDIIKLKQLSLKHNYIYYFETPGPIKVIEYFK